ncbi:MAG TPA: hypothetical protein PKV96_02110 [Candidatus Saccharimonas sp.]|nr:hypothetical protein [Candidatus Saccharimonas sp.]
MNAPKKSRHWGWFASFITATMVAIGVLTASPAQAVAAPTYLTYYACDSIALGYGVTKRVGNSPNVCQFLDVAYLPFTGLATNAKPSAYITITRDSYGYMVVTDGWVDVPATYAWANTSYIKLSAYNIIRGGTSNGYAVSGTAKGVRITTGLTYTDRVCLNFYNYGTTGGVSRC